MRTKGKYTAAKLPTVDMVLAFLNDEPGSIEQVLAQRGHPVQYAPEWMGQKKSIERKNEKIFSSCFSLIFAAFAAFAGQKGENEI